LDLFTSVLTVHLILCQAATPIQADAEFVLKSKAHLLAIEFGLNPNNTPHRKRNINSLLYDIFS